MLNVQIAPSILAANFGNLQQDIEMINQSEAEMIHCDIMDGVFVPNISFGFPVLNYVNKIAKKPLDVHLMIVQPERYIADFKSAGADLLTVHLEACQHLHKTIGEIKSKGMKAGVALNPHTPISLIFDIIDDLDLVLVMSVNPGFGGQSFIEHSYRKINSLKNIIINRSLNTLIQVDGGVNQNNVKKLINAGADILVAGSFVFNSNNPNQTIAALRCSN